MAVESVARFVERENQTRPPVIRGAKCFTQYF